MNFKLWQNGCNHSLRGLTSNSLWSASLKVFLSKRLRICATPVEKRVFIIGCHAETVFFVTTNGFFSSGLLTNYLMSSIPDRNAQHWSDVEARGLICLWREESMTCELQSCALNVLMRPMWWVLIDWTGRPLRPHLGIEAWVLTHVTDVDGQSRGGHQLSDAVIDQPIGTR